MSAIPTIRDNPNGLHRRYTVTKNNGEPVDHLATYFVLRLDSHGRDGMHVEACRAAARRYALTILANPEAAHLHQMAQELEILVTNLEREHA
jgi:hypothetical protein